MTFDTLCLWIDWSVQLQFEELTLPHNLWRQIIYPVNSKQKSYKNQRLIGDIFF